MTGTNEHSRAPSERFTGDEWSLLADAPLLAAMKVLAAGRRGNIRGTLAVARECAAARERDSGAPVNELLDGPAPDVRARARDRNTLAGEPLRRSERP